MKLAFVFPGQGAQVVGMGRDLYENSPAARTVFEQVDAAVGASVSALCFDGPEETLKETQNTQPALFAVSVAALAALADAGITPDAVAGHSVGEYAALVAAGSLSVADGARLVAARGAAMARAAAHEASPESPESPGTMAAVLGLDVAGIDEACREVNNVGVVSIANLNAPGQTIISGERTAVEAVTPILKARGAKKVMPLAVSGAFHSPLMLPASDEMTPLLTAAEITDPSLPIVANVTADYEKTAGEIRTNLHAQIAGQVRWVETIERLVGDGFTTFIECGPGSVLAGMIKRIAPADAGVVTYPVGDMAGLTAAKEALGL